MSEITPEEWIKNLEALRETDQKLLDQYRNQLINIGEYNKTLIFQKNNLEIQVKELEATIFLKQERIEGLLVAIDYMGRAIFEMEKSNELRKVGEEDS